MIEDNLLEVRQRIERACGRAGRDPKEITLVCVSKGRGQGQVREAIGCGVTDIGENKVQEAQAKFKALDDLSTKIRWHMIGHLQTNKVKEAVRMFGLIHSVDSLELARKLDLEAARAGKIQQVLLEIKTSREGTKYGFSPDAAAVPAGEIALLKNLEIRGLMTIAAISGSQEEARPYFALLRGIKDDINASGVLKNKLTVLSMGMTDDFEAAVEEGATMVRIGRAIFEEKI